MTEAPAPSAPARIFAYVPHASRDRAQQLGWMFSARLPRPHGDYADLWEHRCCCGRPAIHPCSERRLAHR